MLIIFLQRLDKEQQTKLADSDRNIGIEVLCIIHIPDWTDMQQTYQNSPYLSAVILLTFF